MYVCKSMVYIDKHSATFSQYNTIPITCVHSAIVLADVPLTGLPIEYYHKLWDKVMGEVTGWRVRWLGGGRGWGRGVTMHLELEWEGLSSEAIRRGQENLNEIYLKPAPRETQLHGSSLTELLSYNPKDLSRLWAFLLVSAIGKLKAQQSQKYCIYIQ